MGIFSRFRDIINANINSMLDKAEDPEKLIKLMIREMEDTLVELKASCAGAIAAQTKSKRKLEEATSKANRWQERAELAMNKGHEDLAREALLEKRGATEQVEALEGEQTNLASIVEQYKSDIAELEAKLEQARKKHRVLVQRHVHAARKERAQSNIRRVHSADVMGKFDALETRIDRMEADADLVNYGAVSNLDDAFSKFETDEKIEAELEALRNKNKEPKKESE
jgi:phage shock protein A